MINAVIGDQIMLMAIHNKYVDLKSDCIEMKCWIVIADYYIQIDDIHHLKSR